MRGVLSEILSFHPIGSPLSSFSSAPKRERRSLFYALVPLFQEEMDLKLKVGIEELEQRLEKAGVGFVLDVNRTNVAARKGWFR
ncbi:MAG TPA: suppressor of fused domain protein [Hyphomicrobiaceae bacterium]|nr:suppressor of fused domain protein [Hyphomicrobiaceae bacterium]